MPDTARQGRDNAVELRVRIHCHLIANPWLTMGEITRAMNAGSTTSVRRALRKMEADGEAERRVDPKGVSDSGPVTRWKAT